MFRYLIRRTSFLLASLGLSIFALFIILRVLGNPIYSLISVGSSPSDAAALEASLGLDKPMPVQFWEYIVGLFHFDLGTSVTNHLSVGDELVHRLNVTLPLTLISFGVGVILAFVTGYIAAAHTHTWYGAVCALFSQLSIAVPAFWISILLIAVFALRLGIFPAGGFPEAGWRSPAEALHALSLPVLAIAIVSGGDMARYVRSATLDVLHAGYISTARALGQSYSASMLRHGLRNGIVPVISIMAIELATTFVGAVIIENVFALPGVGSMLVTAITEKDFTSAQGVLLFSTVLVLTLGFVADIAQRIIDPRLRDSLSTAAKVDAT